MNLRVSIDWYWAFPVTRGARYIVIVSMFWVKDGARSLEGGNPIYGTATNEGPTTLLQLHRATCNDFTRQDH